MGGNRQNIESDYKYPEQYKVILSKDAVEDIKQIKQYILLKFKYKEYAENFSIQIKSAINALRVFTKACCRTEYIIEGYEIFYKPHSTYLIFFIIDGSNVIVIRILKDRMHWQSVIERMQKINL